MFTKFKAYPVNFALAVVAVGSTGNGVTAVLKINDGKFEWQKLSVAAFDSNGVLIPNPNVNVKLKTGSYNIVSDDTPLCCLQRADQPAFVLPERMEFDRNDEITFIVTGQSGSQATRVVIMLIGNEDDGKVKPAAPKPVAAK